MQVVEQRVAQAFFDSAGRAQEATTPNIAKDTDKDCDADHVNCVKQQSPGIYLKGGQIIDGPLDDTGDDELEHVNNDQTEQSGQDLGTIFNQVGNYQGSCRFPVFGHWLLASGCWFMATGCWLLVTGCELRETCNGLRVTCFEFRV